AEQPQSPQDQLLIRLRDTPTQGPVLTGLRRLSKPGLRRYATRDEIKTHNRRMGLTIVSTSRGVMSGEQAVSQGIGGELLCEVW
ncbi:MAG: 30S ribosomal protein S8, partial [Proteobacteria bacterium]|nr:30S ribosomal protein S8 [Pseudomonadota bacterium]